MRPRPVFCLASALAALALASAGAEPGASAWPTSPDSPAAERVPLREVFELSVAKAVSYTERERLRDVRLALELVSPAGRRVAVAGFYYGEQADGRALWKARFAPDEPGTWRYAWILASPGARDEGTGAFACAAQGARAGSLRPSPVNRFRFVAEGGGPLALLGLNELELDGGDMHGAFGQNASYVIDSAGMARLAADAGLNVARMRQLRGLFALCDDAPDLPGDGVCEALLPQPAIAFDERMRAMRAAGLRIVYGIFGNRYRSEDLPPRLAEEQRRLLDWSVARFAAFVDVWQLNNERYAPASWVREAAAYLRSIDPYRRPICESWSRGAVPDLPEIDLHCPHWYTEEPELESDRAMAEQAAAWKRHGKPVLATEHGNADVSWSPASAARLRLRAWTAFFEEVALVLYATPHTDRRFPGSSNLYLGPEERAQLQALQRFAALVLEPDTRVLAPPPRLEPASGVRVRALASARRTAVYLHRPARGEPARGRVLALAIPRAGTGLWLEPASGRVLERLALEAGPARLAVPPLAADLAFLALPGPLSAAPLARVRVSNPQWDGDLDDDGARDVGPAEPPFGRAPLTLALDARESLDWDGGPLEFAWEFGDGTRGAGARVRHTWPRRGVYLARLVVRDDEGDEAAASFAVRATADPHPAANDAPWFHPEPERRVRAGSALWLVPRALDRERRRDGPGHVNERVRVRPVGELPRGAFFGRLRRAGSSAGFPDELLWIPDASQAGVHELVFEGVDPHGAAAEPLRVRVVVEPPPPEGGATAEEVGHPRARREAAAP